MPDLRPTRYETWEHRSDRPLLVLAALFLVVFLIPLYAPDLPGWERSGLGAVNIAIWAVFAVDYLVRLRLAPQRRAFVRAHIADLLAVVPFLRPLRLLRLVGMLGGASRRARQRSQLQTTAFIVGAIGVLLVVAGGLILDAERGAKGANITTASDALWWATTTVTTVGYGDRYPVPAAAAWSRAC